jgi:hypothetical protein
VFCQGPIGAVNLMRPECADIHQGRSISFNKADEMGPSLLLTASRCAMMAVETTIKCRREETMANTTTIGLDLAKQVFHVVGQDSRGTVTVKKVLRRGQMMAFFAKVSACRMGMEARASAHY